MVILNRILLILFVLPDSNSTLYCKPIQSFNCPNYVNFKRGYRLSGGARLQSSWFFDSYQNAR
jgi:hypothetical protein